MSPHRTPGEVIPDGPEPLPKGPATTCKGCGSGPIRVVEWCSDGATPYKQERALDAPIACTPGARVGFLWWRCRKPGEHLHERCRVCGLEWLTAFAEGA